MRRNVLLAIWSVILCLIFVLGESARAQGSDFQLPFYPKDGLHLRSGPVFVRNYDSDSGPVEGKLLLPGMRLVKPPSGNYPYYGTYYHEFYQINPNSGAFESIALPEGVSWPSAVAYDPKRARVLLVSFGSGGDLYAFGINDAIWSRIGGMEGRDYDSIAYDPANDVIWAFEQSGGINKLSPTTGTVLGSISLPALGLHIGPAQYHSELVDLGNNLLALLIEREMMWDSGSPEEQRIYLINKETGHAELTFQKVHEKWPPQNAPPVVSIISPGAETYVSMDETVTFRATASDPDGQLEGVRFVANGIVLGKATPVTRDGQTVYEFVWTNPWSARFEVIAEAMDGDSAVSRSTSVLVVVEGDPRGFSFPMSFYPTRGATPLPNGAIFWRYHTLAEPSHGQSRLLPGMRLIGDNAGYFYGTGGHEVYRLNAQTKQIEPMTLPPTVPELSWPDSLAFDMKRNRILLISHGGEGHLYAYAPETQTWSLVSSLQNHDFDSLVYHPPTDSLFAYGHGGLVELDAESGTILRNIPMPNTPFSFLPGTYQTQLVTIEEYLGLIVEPKTGASLPNAVSEMYAIRPRDGLVERTFRREWQQWPPHNTPPAPEIASPSDGDTFHEVGERIRLTVITADPDSEVVAMEFFINGRSVGFGIRTTSFGPFGFYLDWVPLTAGNYTLTVKAVDDQGAIGNSSEVRFQVGDPAVDTFGLNFFRFDENPANSIITRLYTPSGPVEGKRLLPHDRVVLAHNAWYGIAHHWEVFRVSPNTGIPEKVDIKAEFPDFDWPVGVTYASTHDKLFVATLVGEGALYSYSFAENKWTEVASLNNVDLANLHYHAADNGLWALEGVNRLNRYDLNGTQTESIEMPRLPFFIGVHGYRAAIASFGNKLALLMEPKNEQEGQPLESRIYIFDPATKQFTLTYRHEWDKWVPENALPGIRLMSPANGVEFTVGDPIDLVALASDSDVAVYSVEFFANGQKLAEPGYEYVAGKVYRSKYSWANAPIGTHTIFARVKDHEGGVTDSTPVTITVKGPENEFSLDFFRFALNPADSIIHRVYTPTGPESGKRLLFPEQVVKAGQWWYGVSHYQQVFRFLPVSGIPEKVELTSIFPEFSWPTAITFDPDRQTLFLSTLGGEGFLYAFSLAEGGWRRVKSLNNVDVVALHYHQADGALWAVGNSQLLRYTLEGELIESVALPSMPFSIGVHGHNASLASYGSKLALLLEPKYVQQGAATESRIYIFDPATKQFSLTYRHSWPAFPPDNTPPVVRLTGPSNGSEYEQGVPIEFTALASDADVGVYSVEFFINGERVAEPDKLWIAAKVVSSTFVWQNAPVGTHTVFVRVKDHEGGSTDSETRTIIVKHSAPPVLITAERDLPELYQPGQPVRVQITVTPGAQVRAYGVEDQPPQGWRVSAVLEDGSYDPATGKVKFGPFIDNQTRTLFYTVTPSADTVGAHSFRGHVSANGQDFSITGDQEIAAGSQFHPADISPRDSAIRLGEVTAYAAAWRTGKSWEQGPNPIPPSYVTRAGLIWRRGENYVFNPRAGAPPLCWVPAGPAVAEFTAAPPLPAGAQRALTENPDGTLTVSILVQPPSGTASYAIEEHVPAGWITSNISADGTASANVVRWGPFYDSNPRALNYTVSRGGNAAAIFAGRASFDGKDLPIDGDRYVDDGWLRVASAKGSGNTITLRFPRPEAGRAVVEFAPTLDAEWTTIRTLDSTAPGDALIEVQLSNNSGFYRVRIAP